MTAIAGLWSFGAVEPVSGVARMLRSLALYGGDHDASDAEGAVAMARSLRRTLPEDRHDRGPVRIRGGDGLVVADARIDNRGEVEEALGIDRDRARITSDAALLAAAIERWEEEAVARVIGDFAFAWWDAPRERLVLGRDHAGNRPLFYHRGKDFIAFASMTKGLHALDAVPRAPRIPSVAALLALIPETGSETLFEGVEKVLGGHLTVLTRDRARDHAWWNPEPGTLDLPRDADYPDALRAELDRAVRAQSRRIDGPLGTHLSAGFDSGSVTATAARALAPERLFAFTSVPSFPIDRETPGRISDEGPIAALVASRYPNIDHVSVRTHGASPIAGLERSQFLFDRPVTNVCNMVWIEAIMREARDRGVRVMLTGQMGNMTLSYNGRELLPQLFRSGRWFELARLLPGLRRDGMRWRGIAMSCAGPFLPKPLWDFAHRFGGRKYDIGTYSALRSDAFEAHGLGDLAASRGHDLSYRGWTEDATMRRWVLSRVDMGPFQKGLLAGWGIDQRDPTGDRRLFEFTLAVPTRQFILGGEARSLGRRAFRSMLPPEVLDERRRGLQAADWHVGATAARDEMREELDRLAECEEVASILDIPRLRAQLDAWPEGGWESDDVVERYRLAMLRGIGAGQFLRKALGSNR